MKKKQIISFIMSILCVCLLAIPTFASEVKASDQIRAYSIDATSSAGSLNIKFSITGRTSMDKLGCESIEVYKKFGSSWILSTSFDESDPGMSKSSSIMHANTITCAGVAGVEYKVVVTVFAENSVGRDTRTKTVYVTGK